jgi:membrane fusion protein, multidrug efflux system
MKKLVLIALIVVAGVGLTAYFSGIFGEKPTEAAAQNSGSQGQGRGQGGNAGGFQGGGGGGFPGGGGNFRGGGGRGGRSGPMTVEIGSVRRATIAQELTVVGNLIGETTVSVAPRAAGRLQEVYVRLGDRVGKGQRIAKIEDFELVEQLKQQEAAQEVAQATIRQRDADLALAKTNVDRSRSLFERQLLPKQTLDDNEARYQSAQAQLDLARAQAQQSKARLDELKINLANTIITSPVNGFVAKRNVDPGASVGQNAPVVDVVDISRVRLIVNVVEKDLKQLQAGDETRVEVDAFPGEMFMGRIARVSPVLDPATRTAPIEIEIPNPTYRLKPGMYARVGITLDTTKDALVVPATALVDLGGRRGVFQPANDIAVFRAVQVGTEQRDIVEVLGGLTEGAEVVTTGAGQLRDGDRIQIVGARGRGRGSRGGEGGGQPSADSASNRRGGEPAAASQTSSGEFRGRTAASGAAAAGEARRFGGQFNAEGRSGSGQFGGRRGRRGDQGQATGTSANQPTQPATQP